MGTVKFVTSELTWCLRCSLRYRQRSASLQPLSFQSSTQRRLYTADAIPAAALEGEEKQYAPKIKQLVKDISQLNLLEVADLNELLKKSLKIADAPLMAFGAVSSAAKLKSEETEVPEAKQEQINFSVKLTKFEDSKKVALIKEVKNLVPGLNLVQAKKFVESLPQLVKTDIAKEEAEKLKAVLEAVGATVVLS